MVVEHLKDLILHMELQYKDFNPATKTISVDKALFLDKALEDLEYLRLLLMEPLTSVMVEILKMKVIVAQG